MDSIRTGLGNAMMKVKDAIYNVLLQLIIFKIINLQFIFFVLAKKKKKTILYWHCQYKIVFLLFILQLKF
ncbi:hypothetical protein D9R21_05015 [Spiroplasma endosymbiont of Megaselia nigra]|nr:hypothetical protein D9R21_05015 [Spiroplasma endosymbiont of Megaselia nigra]